MSNQVLQCLNTESIIDRGFITTLDLASYSCHDSIQHAYLLQGELEFRWQIRIQYEVYFDAARLASQEADLAYSVKTSYWYLEFLGLVPPRYQRQRSALPGTNDFWYRCDWFVDIIRWSGVGVRCRTLC